MKRMHIHISVDQLSSSVQFYTKIFGAAPSVLKEDYAKWQLDEPRVNFAISSRGAPVGLNHLGIQTETADELAQMKAQLDLIEASVTEQIGTACCYAKSDKYWVNDPSGIPWETFHTLDSIPIFSHDSASDACCVPGELATISIPSISKKTCC